MSKDESRALDSAANSIPTAGLDHVLEALKGPKAVSTIAKSSADWDNFKEETGLDSDLANVGKDGYV